MEPARRLAGVVLLSDGSAAVGSDVCLTTTSSLDIEWLQNQPSSVIDEHGLRSWSLATVTDSTGRFEFQAVPLENWTLAADSANQDRSRLEFKHTADSASEDLQIQLTEDTCWHVKVLDEDGVGLADSTVRVSDWFGGCSWREGITTKTNGDGLAEICKIESWGAIVKAHGPGHLRDFIRNTEPMETVVLQLNRSAAIKGVIAPFTPGDCPCFHFASGPSGLGMDLEVHDDGSFYADHIRPGQNMGSFHTCAGNYSTPKSWDLEPDEIRDVGRLKLKKRRSTDSSCIDQETD
jgi:hypothetical protein